MVTTRERFVYDPSLVLYLPLHEMVKGRSSNLLRNGDMETGSPPSYWSGTRATLSAETVIKKSGSQSLKVLSNDGAGAGTSNADSSVITSYAKYAGITAIVHACVLAPSANDKNQNVRIYDGVASGVSNNFAKDDAWHLAKATKKITTSPTTLFVEFRSKDSPVADTDDIVYVDDVELTVPAITDRSRYGHVIYPEGVTTRMREWDSDGIDDFLAADISQLNFTSGDFSGIVRVKLDTLPGAGASRSLIGRGLSSTDGWSLIFGGATNDINFYTNQSGASQISIAAGLLNTSRYFTIGWSRSGSSVRLYLNGNDRTSTAASHTDPTGNASRYVRIGANNGLTTFLDGQTVEFLVFSRLLTPQEHLFHHERLMRIAP